MNWKPENSHPDLQAPCGESAMNSVANWGDKPESLGRIDLITTASRAGSAHSSEIKIDKSYRVLNSNDNQRVRVGLVFGALMASTSLTWFAISALPFPFTSTSGGGSSVNIDSSARILDSKKEDRLRMPATIVAPAQAPESRNLSLSSAINHAKQSLRAATTTMPGKEGDLQTRAKLNPAPETRPTTIEGWTLREVTNGTAVLEGPDGIRRVARGDTIPGVGKVESIFRWGSRLIVATSRGLISTP